MPEEAVPSGSQEVDRYAQNECKESMPENPNKVITEDVVLTCLHRWRALQLG
jgi:hypothetical protein